MLGENRRVFTGGKFSLEAVFTIDGEERRIRGVFDDAFYDAKAGENVLETSLPRLTCRFSETAGIVRETPAVINGENFSVLEVQPDKGTGLAVITFAHDEE